MQAPSYPINQSPLYKLQSKKKLAEMLGMTAKALQALSVSRDNYNVFEANERPRISHPLFAKKPRTVQELKGELVVVHRALHRHLKRISVPTYLHSAVKKHSYATNAKAHIGCKTMYHIDIKKFYESIKWKTVFRFFKNDLLCSPDVATLLTNLCCYNDKLPTGSCLSPIISFLANKPMFERLNQYAIANGLTMTVYIDDVVFSGDIFKKSYAFDIKGIISSYGYRCHKEQFRREHDCKIVTGLVITDSGLSIPNKRMAKARVLIDLLAQTSEPRALEWACNSLTGMINEMRQFDASKAKILALEGRRFCPVIQKISNQLCA